MIKMQDRIQHVKYSYCINIIIIVIIIIIIIIIIKNYSISHLARLHIAALINFRVSNLDTSKDEAARHLHPIPFNPLDYEDRGRLTNDGTLHDGCKRNSLESAQIQTRDVCDEISRISGMSTSKNGPNGDHQCNQNGQRQGWVANRGATEKCRSYAPLDSVHKLHIHAPIESKGTAEVAVVQSR